MDKENLMKRIEAILEDFETDNVDISSDKETIVSYLGDAVELLHDAKFYLLTH